MEIYELFEEIEEYRRKIPTRDVAPSYKYKQGYNKDGRFYYYRHYTCELILYLDNDNHMRVLNDIVNHGYNFACILHDQDLLESENETEKEDNKSVGAENVEKFENDFENLEIIVEKSEFVESENPELDVSQWQSFDGIHKKPHIHCVLWFSEARTNTAVAKDLKMDSYLCTMYSKLESRLRYLTHIDYREKYQYSPNKVVGNLSCRIPQLIAEYGRRQTDLVYEIVKRIENCDAMKIIRMAEFFSTLHKDGFDGVLTNKYMGIIKSCIDEHNFHARWMIQNHWKRVSEDCPFIEI